MRAIDHDEARVRPEQSLQVVQVEAEAAVAAYLPQRHITAKGVGDAVELLVGRIGRDDVVSRIQQHIEQQEVGLDSTGGDDNVLRTAILVGPCQQAAQLQGTSGLRVAQPHFQQFFKCAGALAFGTEVQ